MYSLLFYLQETLANQGTTYILLCVGKKNLRDEWYFVYKWVSLFCLKMEAFIILFLIIQLFPHFEYFDNVLTLNKSEDGS